MRTSRKRTIAIIVPVTVLALAGIATAAGLTTTSATLGGGSTTVTNNCAIAVSYSTTGTPDISFQAPVAAVTGTPATPGGYYLKFVTLTPTGSDCGGAAYRVTVAKQSGAALSEVFGSFGANGATLVAVKVAVNAYAFDVGAVYATVTNNAPVNSGPTN